MNEWWQHRAIHHMTELKSCVWY